MKDNFSKQANAYAKYRPTYPQELYDFILSKVEQRDVTWDCGTGNGQTAKELAKYFKKVFATDISEKQIQNAHKADNIFYSVQPAEQTRFENNTFNLITVSQALHWFNFEKFYSEVKRVGRPGSWLAVWVYSLLRISKDIDPIVEDFFLNMLEKYWDAERKYVDDNYVTIPFPFEEIKRSAFSIEFYWTLDELEGYFVTVSALQKFLTANNDNPLPELMNKIRPYWTNETMKVIFPIHLQMGRIEK